MNEPLREPKRHIPWSARWRTISDEYFLAITPSISALAMDPRVFIARIIHAIFAKDPDGGVGGKVKIYQRPLMTDEDGLTILDDLKVDEMAIYVGPYFDLIIRSYVPDLSLTDLLDSETVNMIDKNVRGPVSQRALELYGENAVQWSD